MDQNKAGDSPNAVGTSRSEKPLGRGLEEIAHVFLSQRRSEPASNDQASVRAPEKVPVEAEPSSGVVLLRPSGPITRDRLAALLTEFQGGIEDGLRKIDANVPSDPHGEIDLLAIDQASQLVIIDFETVPNDGLLLRGMTHFDWIMRQLPLVRRLYRGHPINFSIQPRLFLIAPEFSSVMTSAARHITRPAVDWIRYRLVTIPGGQGVFFERFVGS